MEIPSRVDKKHEIRRMCIFNQLNGGLGVKRQNKNVYNKTQSD